MGKIIGPRGLGYKIVKLVNKLFYLKEYEKVVKVKMIDNNNNNNSESVRVIPVTADPCGVIMPLLD